MRHNVELNRRAILMGAVGAVGATALPVHTQEAEGPTATRGRIKQSIAHWPFNVAGDKWDLEQTCRIARQLGCVSVELVKGNEHEIVRKHGLTCALAQIDLDPPFVRAFNNPAHWPVTTRVTKQAIDEAAQYGSPNVICFTGYSAKDPDNPSGPKWSPEEGADHCVAGLKQVIGYAEKKGVNLCLEVLNTRDTSHPMKGHPGYQGDSTEYCIDIIKRVGSLRMKLLFDVYHVQIMDGDIIRRIHEHKDYIGHVHVAGNPGRGELDDKQEISFRPVMQALVDIGYQGCVGHEYIPTRNPLTGLREAVALCDV
ncbi:MAG: TIM barrel protein [Phycisphaeraceae bacterium]|nr:TIM barrel protein [Phycisphaeraceae bacterium]